MQYWIDSSKKTEGKFVISGWGLPSDPAHTLKLKAISNGELAETDTIYQERGDVAMNLVGSAEHVNYGFNTIIDAEKYPVLTITLYSEDNPDDFVSFELSEKHLNNSKNTDLPRKIIRAARGFIKSDNKSQFLKDTFTAAPDSDKRYRKWLKEQKVSLHELRRQADDVFPYMPTISLVVPVYNPKPAHIKAMVKSVMNQSYQNWQLCLANGNGENLEIAKLIRTFTNSDSRIVTARLKENRGISGNTNVGIQMAEGEWIAFADQDDLLAPNAFYEYIKAINNNPKTDALYCDEDKLDDDSGKHFMPNFKPDFNLDLLLTNNYVCHMFMVRQSVIDEVGPLRKEFDGSQDHDFILRCSNVCRHIEHVPKVLYYWRCHAKSTASDSRAKTYVVDAGARAIKDYYRTRGLDVRVSGAKLPSFYRTDFDLLTEPKVSVLIPNKDHIDDLERCIHSFIEKCDYKNYEIIIIENNSEDPDTFVGYKRLEREDTRIRTITWKGEGFNYASLNNFGAANAKGEFLLLLNNDTELISSDLLTHMVGYTQRPEIAVVGPKLLYPDHTVQHAGVLIGVDHSAFHVFLGLPNGLAGYMGRAGVSQNMSGVTGACMLVRKSVWDEVKGMDEDFAVAYNDVDFCLKIEKAGYLCLYDAFVSMFHYESKTRGSDMTEENKVRLEKERLKLIEKWGARMDADPYYNINLSLKNGYYELP